MRRRLTVAILILVAATLVVTTLGSFYFIRRTEVATAQQELAGQAQAISRTFSGDTAITKTRFRRELTLIADAGAFSDASVVRLHPDGTIDGQLPADLPAATLDIDALQSGHQVTGHTSSMVAYSAVPIPIDAITAYVPVLVITRPIHNPLDGIRYFVVVGAIALVIAALVAAALARRITRPLTAAVDATKRIASGDLDARVAVGPREDAEFVQLAASINAMGSNLVRARDQERQFILSVSHELRTPLTSIRGYADAVIDGAAEDPRSAATVISSEARRLERLVQDLLDLGRLDADRFSMERHPVDCARVVGQVVDGFRPRMEELGLQLSIASGSDQPLWIDGDADRLGQVVANLVENASTFAEGQVVVGSGAVAGLPTVWVVDDGAGIPPDHLDRVFERHFVSDRVSQRRTGSGLGLAIVTELASAMGGRVWAESPVADGRGTRMVVSFPARHAPGSAPGSLGPGPDPVPPAGQRDTRSQ